MDILGQRKDVLNASKGQFNEDAEKPNVVVNFVHHRHIHKNKKKKENSAKKKEILFKLSDAEVGFSSSKVGFSTNKDVYDDRPDGVVPKSGQHDNSDMGFDGRDKDIHGDENYESESESSGESVEDVVNVICSRKIDEHLTKIQPKFDF